MHYSFYSKWRKKLSLNATAYGFTLLELLVVIAILGTLLLAAAFILNPTTQLSKADDVRRKQDLGQIKNALDVYYNDHSCYPQSIPFGSEWKEGSTVYMTQVPQDKACEGDLSLCYRYVREGAAACPQWHILFAKQDLSQQTATSCPLSTTPNCQPDDFSTSWACEMSGSVDCAFLQSYSLDSPPDYDPGVTPTPGSLPTPTPTVDPCPEENRNYACTGEPFRCNLVPQGTGTYCTSACGGAC